MSQIFYSILHSTFIFDKSCHNLAAMTLTWFNTMRPGQNSCHLADNYSNAYSSMKIVFWFKTHWYKMSMYQQLLRYNGSTLTWWQASTWDYYDLVYWYIYATLDSRGPFCWEGLTLIPPWINNNIHFNVWGDITYQFPNFNNAPLKFGNR